MAALLLTKGGLVSLLCGSLFLMSCGKPSAFNFRANPVRAKEYSSNKITLHVGDYLSTYYIEWLCVDTEWFCRIITESAQRTENEIDLKVKTDSEERVYHFAARKGGDVFRTSSEDTQTLIKQLIEAKTAILFIGSSFQQIDTETFKRLIKKGGKKQFTLPI